MYILFELVPFILHYNFGIYTCGCSSFIFIGYIHILFSILQFINF